MARHNVFNLNSDISGNDGFGWTRELFQVARLIQQLDVRDTRNLLDLVLRELGFKHILIDELVPTFDLLS